MAVTYSQYGVIIRGSGGIPFSINSIVNIVPIQQMVVVDKNGYIGYNITQYFQYAGNTYYYNYAILDKSANYEESGLGQVTFYTPANNIIGGREYRTVIIGGKEWMAENLDYKFTGLAINPKGSPSKPAAWYYDRNEAMYGIDGTRKCGLLYNWPAVKYLEDNKATIIPGWHVPTDAEWTALTTAVGSDPGTKLKALNDSATSGFPSGWNGTDDYGFGVLPAGFYNSSFYSINSAIYFWSATKAAESLAWYRSFNTSSAITKSTDYVNRGYSVRLVKDSN